jgi:hypothetical protein
MHPGFWILTVVAVALYIPMFIDIARDLEDRQ